MQFDRRRHCVYCNKVLVRKPNEKTSRFNERITCGISCTRKLYQLQNKKKCFCGEYTNHQGEYCSWEHRLIDMKCRQWGIEVSIPSYNFHVSMLVYQQNEYDVQTNKKEPSENLKILYYRQLWLGKKG